MVENQRWSLLLVAITVKGQGTKRNIAISCIKGWTSQGIWRVVKRNGAHAIAVTIIRTRTVTSSSRRQSQEILVVTEKYGVIIIMVLTI